MFKEIVKEIYPLNVGSEALNVKKLLRVKERKRKKFSTSKNFFLDTNPD